MELAASCLTQSPAIYLTRLRGNMNSQIQVMDLPPKYATVQLVIGPFCGATLAEPHILSCGDLLCYGCIDTREQDPDDHFTCTRPRQD